MSGGGPAGPSDAELVARFRDGDRSAFTTLASRHERRVYNVAYRIMGRSEDARDVTQDAFLSCFRHLGSFRGDAAFTTWLHRITVNACYDALRKRPPEPVPMERLEPSPIRDHADQAVAVVDVQRALARVPVEFRATLVLHDVQGLPYEEVAVILNVPVGTVKSRLHRGRLALARLLGGEPPVRPGGEPRQRPAASKPPTRDAPEPALPAAEPTARGGESTMPGGSGKM